MAIFTKEFLTGGAGNGQPIAVAAIATVGTLIHTADATAKDELHLAAVNVTAADVILTIEFGGVTTAHKIVVEIVRESGLIIVVDKRILSGGLIVGAFAGTANAINIVGFVNRIT